MRRQSGYSYAGLSAPSRAYGVSAVVTPLNAFDVLNGHVAGWVGVGGPGEGPGGSNEWLQIGLSGFPGITGSDVYYEIALPHRFPTYHQVATAVPAGKAVKVTVLEMRSRPNYWRVWLNHKAVSRADLPAPEPRPLDADRHRRELGRRDGRHVQHLPLSLPPRRCRAVDGRRLAPAEERVSDQQLGDPRAPSARGRDVPRGGRPAGLPVPLADYALIQIGVPSGASVFMRAAVVFDTRTQPCETALPRSCGRLVPWMPTTPPPGHSVSFE